MYPSLVQRYDSLNGWVMMGIRINDLFGRIFAADCRRFRRTFPDSCYVCGLIYNAYYIIAATAVSLVFHHIQMLLLLPLFVEYSSDVRFMSDLYQYSVTIYLSVQRMQHKLVGGLL